MDMIQMMGIQGFGVKKLVQAINLTRPATTKPILEVAECDFCGEDFAIQPQDKGRILKIRGRFCCWATSCRKVLRKAQNQEAKLVNPEAT
jgi:hypothetical protein